MKKNMTEFHSTDINSTHVKKVKSSRITTANAIFGIDAGSTTTKVALVGEDGTLLYSFYSNNNGSPLSTTVRAIQEIYCADCLMTLQLPTFLFHRLR